MRYGRCTGMWSVILSSRAVIWGAYCRTKVFSCPPEQSAATRCSHWVLWSFAEYSARRPRWKRLISTANLTALHTGSWLVVKPTGGGHGELFDTIPIYAVGCRFPYTMDQDSLAWCLMIWQKERKAMRAVIFDTNGLMFDTEQVFVEKRFWCYI